MKKKSMKKNIIQIGNFEEEKKHSQKKLKDLSKRKTLIPFDNSSESLTEEKEMEKLSNNKVTQPLFEESSMNSSSLYSAEKELEDMKKKLDEQIKILKQKQKEEEEKAKKIKKKAFNPYESPPLTFESPDVQLNTFEIFNLNVCPECNAKIKRFPVKQYGDVVRQFIKCKKCDFQKELIFKI